MDGRWPASSHDGVRPDPTRSGSADHMRTDLTLDARGWRCGNARSMRDRPFLTRATAVSISRFLHHTAFRREMNCLAGTAGDSYDNALAETQKAEAIDAR